MIYIVSNLNYKTKTEITKRMKSITGKSILIITLLLWSGVMNASAEDFTFDKDQIIKEINKLTPTEFLYYIKTDKTIQSNPKAMIFSINSAFDKWGDKIDKFPVYYGFLASRYLRLKKVEKAWEYFCFEYEHLNPLVNNEPEKVLQQTIEKEIHAIDRFRRSNAFYKWLEPYVLQKAREFLKKYPDISKEQKDRVMDTVNLYERLERERKELRIELKKVRQMADNFLRKEASFYEKKDKNGLKNFFLKNMEDKERALYYTNDSYEKFSKFDKVDFIIIRIIKHPSMGYIVSYTWKTTPGETHKKDKNSIGYPFYTFQIKNNKLILVD